MNDAVKLDSFFNSPSLTRAQRPAQQKALEAAQHRKDRLHDVHDRSEHLAKLAEHLANATHAAASALAAAVGRAARAAAAIRAHVRAGVRDAARVELLLLVARVELGEE